MDYEHTIEVDAAPDRIWAIMSDVERWPEWTGSMRRVERLETGPLAVGSTARVHQPRLPAVVWRVTSLEPARGFTWEARSPGVHTIGIHRIEPRAGGGSSVTLGVHSSGIGAALMTPLIAGITRRYVRMEAEGLKARAEGQPVNP
jgi:hypothetical protein